MGKQPLVLPFTSRRKRITSTFKDDDKIRVFSKGASELIIDRCTKIHVAGGNIVELDEKLSDEIRGREGIHKLAR